MHFSMHLRLRKRSPSPEPRELQISDPISKNFDYGPGGVPPWMNDYATHLTEPVATRHAARKNYHSKHEYALPPPPPRNFSYSGGRTYSTSSSVDLKLSTPAHDPNLPPPLLQTPSLFSRSSSPRRSMDDSDIASPPKTPVKKRRMNFFFRNRGVDERGQLRDEWEEIGDADWGCPDEYGRGRKWYE